MADETVPVAGESETEQDLDVLNSEEESTDAESDSEEEPGEDRTPSRRVASGIEEDTEDEEEEESDEEDEEEGKLEDIDEEEEEEVVGDKPDYARPPIKAIKEKYPNLFKDFPQLKAAFFNYPQYTEVFADVDSAKEAAAKAAEYDNLETTIVNQADPSFLLKTLAENNPKALKKMVGNFGTALRQADNDAYISLTTPIIEELLYHAAAHGSKVGNKNLTLAARHMANFVFANGGEIPDISKHQGKSEPSEAEKQLDIERRAYASEKYDSAFTDVVKLIDPEINGILNNKLEGLSSFERKQIVKESRDEIGRILNKDKSFQQTLRNLWRKAAESGYSSESKSRIKRTWLDRAKLVAPSVRNRLKQEALSSRNGSKGKVSDKEQESKIKFKVTSEKRTFPDKGGKTPSGPSKRGLDPKKIDWRKTSDRDILDMN